jgi:Ca2+-binding EF-hand superfamily protein
MNRIQDSRMAPELIEELREDFAGSDTDGDGRIDFPEFSGLMENLGAGMSSSDLRIGFDEIDADRDGRISLSEFVAWRSQG